MALLHLFTHKGTVKGPSKTDFDAETAAQRLHKAFKGLGTDEKTIIDVIGTHTNAQRQTIKRKYKTMYGKDLITDIETELGGHFLELVLALMCPLHLYDAHCIRKAIVGAGTDENLLIELLCTRTNSEMELVKEGYFSEFRRNLEADILDETSGDLSRLLVSMLTANRDETGDEADLNLAAQDAAKLQGGLGLSYGHGVVFLNTKTPTTANDQAGVNRLGTDEEMFNQILCVRSLPQIRATMDEYKKRTKHDLEADIRKEFDGEMQTALVTVVKIAKNPVAYYSEKLMETIRGAGTKDENLIRLIVWRCEIDLEDIKEDFLQRYKRTLSKAVKDDTSGDYMRMLLKIIGNGHI